MKNLILIFSLVVLFLSQSAFSEPSRWRSISRLHAVGIGLGFGTLAVFAAVAFSASKRPVHKEFVARTKAARVDLSSNPYAEYMKKYIASMTADVGDLEWELGRKGSTVMTFAEAEAYAASRKAEGWRLPTVYELYWLCLNKSVLGDDLDTGWFWSDKSVAVVGYPLN